MIAIKNPQQIAVMAEGGKILADILKHIGEEAVPGATTKELDELALKLVIEHHVEPAFLDYEVAGYRYPATLCVSVNDEVVHGLPSSRALKFGDLVGLDMGIIYKGWNLDSALTIPVLNRSSWAEDHAEWEEKNPRIAELIQTTWEALELGIVEARPGNRIGQISSAIQAHVDQHGFGVVRDLVGHGVGRNLHEEPAIPNFGTPDEGPIIKEGMVLAIEPMITAGSWEIVLQKDHWTYKTKDGSWSAHFEHTVAVTKDGPVILTKL